MSVIVTTKDGKIYNNTLVGLDSQSFTITGWAFMALPVSSGTYNTLAFITDGGESNFIGMYVRNDAGVAKLLVGIEDTDNYYELLFSKCPPVNTWFYYAITCINGESSQVVGYWCDLNDTTFSNLQTALFSGDQEIIQFTPTEVIIGNSNFNEPALSSMFSQTRMWTVPMTTTEIMNEKKSSYYIKHANILFSWPLTTRVNRIDQSPNRNKPIFNTLTPAVPDVSFATINLLTGPQYQPSFDNTKTINANTTLSKPRVSVRWSNDGGNSYGNWINKEIGRPGEYLTQVKYFNCGQSRNRVFHVQFTDPCLFNIIGARLEITVDQG